MVTRPWGTTPVRAGGLSLVPPPSTPLELTVEGVGADSQRNRVRLPPPSVWCDSYFINLGLQSVTKKLWMIPKCPHDPRLLLVNRSNRPGDGRLSNVKSPPKSVRVSPMRGPSLLRTPDALGTPHVNRRDLTGTLQNIPTLYRPGHPTRSLYVRQHTNLSSGPTILPAHLHYHPPLSPTSTSVFSYAPRTYDCTPHSKDKVPFDPRQLLKIRPSLHQSTSPTSRYPYPS